MVWTSLFGGREGVGLNLNGSVMGGAKCDGVDTGPACGRKKVWRCGGSTAVPEPSAQSPASARSRLDLPQPEGPTISRDWPAGVECGVNRIVV